MNDFLDELISATGNQYASKVADGMLGNVNEYIDTGSFILNALLSGSIHKGLPSNKITAFAGESATGKTFFLLGLCKQFLTDNLGGGVLYFESESALTPEMVEERNIDTKRFVQFPVATIQEFATQCSKIVDKHIENGEDKPLLLCLDSLGMLSTAKEVGDVSEGADKVDMTKARIVKGAFRVLTLKLAKAGIPLLVTNHTYKQVGTMFPQDVMGGGSGLQYAASNIVFLSKRKEKIGTDVIGNIIHCKNFKSRLTKENKMVDVLLTYDAGLSKYYGLLELAEKYGILKKVSTRYEMPDGAKLYGKQILSDPEKYFTGQIMDAIELAADQEFSYGRGNDAELSTEDIKEQTEG
tara:strand:- start:3660 stop:4718 length:1059 start_codon:yes stop_codon:yes gene_type:complete